MTINCVAVFFHELIPFGGFKIFPDHFGNKFLKGDFWCPSEFLSGFGGVAQKCFNFGGAEVTGIDADDGFFTTSPCTPSMRGT